MVILRIGSPGLLKSLLLWVVRVVISIILLLVVRLVRGVDLDLRLPGLALKTLKTSFRVMGINTNVVNGGTLYTGRIDEPVKSMDSDFSIIDMGVAFESKPSFLYFDYKAVIKNTGSLIMANGRKTETIKGRDMALVLVVLQRRWEKDGKIYAKRVGTGEMFIDKSCNWKMGYELEIDYSKSSSKYSKWTELNSNFYANNFAGKRVVIQEIGWADKNENPTHLILYFASSSCGIFTGEVGNILYLDNIGFGYR